MTVEAMPVRVRVKKKVIMKRRAKLLQDHQVHRGLRGTINKKKIRALTLRRVQHGGSHLNFFWSERGTERKTNNVLLTSGFEKLIMVQRAQQTAPCWLLCILPPAGCSEGIKFTDFLPYPFVNAMRYQKCLERQYIDKGCHEKK